ncbi:MAG: LysR family transcriptional regulator [Labilithrix sp.]|nr:LysR family transcriptional regulator [Labilithrix sp.]MCW5811922.1 LysR family transcriptional regulator [Labilithrix sp.]
MNVAYGRDLDLNLLRVLVAVADTGSVTLAAARLYLTQPAISAALRRLTVAIGAPLVARHGRGVVLTERGAQLVADVRPHLDAVIAASLAPPRFDPRTSERTIRLGLADSAEQWLLPPLLRLLAREAPRMRVVVLPVQFRTVGDALALRRIDMAVTVADELPRAIRRHPLFTGGFVCLFDPRHVKLGKRPSERAYFAHEHVIVSYNGDLRGLVEDYLGRQRRVRCSVAAFHNIGAIVEGSALVATVPATVARAIVRLHPKLQTAPVPFHIPPGSMDLLWPTALDADDTCRFVRDAIIHLTKTTRAASTKGVARGRR